LLRGLASLGVICLIGCSGTRSGGNQQATQVNLQGQEVYQRVCAQCHDATDLHLLKDPPRLDGLFRKQTFPSGAPASDEELRNVILHGRGIMPPFEQVVDGDEVNALIHYMHTR
jgi:mono/diheme cytochrome c family protein